MVKLELLVLILTALTFSCQQPKSGEEIETRWTNFDTGGNEDQKDERKKLVEFETIFEHIDTEENSTQTLAVSWITDDSIEFRLVTDNDLCGTDYWGNAKNTNRDTDPELDEDENGDSYLAAEYVAEQETYALSIRISVEKDKARIIYTDKVGEETDCIPTLGLVLTKKDTP